MLGRGGKYLPMQVDFPHATIGPTWEGCPLRWYVVLPVHRGAHDTGQVLNDSCENELRVICEGREPKTIASC